MAAQQVWDDKVRLFGGDAVLAHFYAYVDFTKVDADIEHAWTFQVDVRVAGIQFWSTNQVTLQNGAVSAQPAPTIAALGEQLPTLQGEIDDWGPVDVGTDGADWTKATAARFLVSSQADVTLPISQLVGLVGRLGGVAGTILTLAAGLFGKKVRVTIGHTNVTIPIHRDAMGRITQVGTQSR